MGFLVAGPVYQVTSWGANCRAPRPAA